MAKLSDSDIQQIIELNNEGFNYTEIGRKIGVTKTTVRRKLNQAGIKKSKRISHCEICGKEFQESDFSTGQRFCSNLCRQKSFCFARGRERYAECAACGRIFEKSSSICCSEECRQQLKEFRKEQKELRERKERGWKQCKYCNGWEYGFKGLYCSNNCRRKARHGNDRDKLRALRARQNGQFDADIDIYKLIERDGSRCYLCGDDVSFLNDYNDPKYPTIEHVLAIANGGTHSWDNVKVACRDCNTRKSTIPLEEFLAEEVEDDGSKEIAIATEIEKN